MPDYSKAQLVAYEVPTLNVTSPGTATSSPYSNDAIGSLSDADARVRVQRMRDVALWAKDNATNLGGSDTLKVFIAPEFYFRSSADSYGSTSVITNLFAALLASFQTSDFADWLIVPGTAFWSQADPDDDSRLLYFNTVFVVRGGTPVTLGSGDWSSAVPVIGNGITNQKGLMSHIDYATSGNRRQDQDGAVNAHFRTIIGDWAWRKGHLFRVKDVNNGSGAPLTFGLEVCLEHARRYRDAENVTRHDDTEDEGVLKGVLGDWSSKEGGSAPAVDLHLVTSCGMDVDAPNVVARQNGYVMLCDGHPAGPNSDLRKKGSSSLTDLTGTGAVFTQNLPSGLQLARGSISSSAWFTQRIVSYAPVTLP